MSRRISIGRISRMRDRVVELDETISVLHIDNKITELKAEFATYRSLLDHEIDATNQEDLEREFNEVEINFEHAMDHLVSLKSNMSANVPDSADSLHEFLQHQQRVLTTITENRLTTSSAPALPKIQIVPFSGNMKEWVAFRDIFSSTIHHNTDLSPVQKMQFLRNSVVDEAASLIRTIPISAANYEVAWRTLMENYNREYMVVESILNRFFSVKVSPTQNNLKSTYNIFRETFEMLKVQGDYANSRDPLAIFLMLRKLDSETDLAWAKFAKRIEQPTIDQFLNFLKEHCEIIDRRNQNPPPQKSSKPNKSFGVNHVVSYTCFFCSEPHSIYKCPKFLALDINAREEFFTNQSRCFNCLSKNHIHKTCPSTRRCLKCNLKHNTLLHRGSIPSNTANSSSHHSKLSPATSHLNAVSKIYSVCSTASLLPTACVNAVTANGNFIPARALLDSGAQTTLISENLANRLGLARVRVSLPLSCLADNAHIKARGKVELKFCSQIDHSVYRTNALILPKLAGSLPQHVIPVQNLNYIRDNFQLADPDFNQPREIDIILSASFLFGVLQPSLYSVSQDHLYLQASKLGYLVCSTSDSTGVSSLNSVTFDSDHENDNLLQKFWELEEVSPVLRLPSASDDECEAQFKNSTVRLDTGRFCVRLPFKFAPSQLGQSYHVAQRRFYYLENKLQSNSSLKSEYTKFMSDYLDSGHMIATSFDSSNLPDSHYIIPHHGIWQNGPNGLKLRVVFDASTKTSSGQSLNDILHVGPPLQKDIVAIIHHFRSYRYVLTSDIEKMYRQILIHEQDQKYQLILWRSEPSHSLKIYQLTTVTYGETSSPFLALRTLQDLIDRDGHAFPEAAHVLLHHRYVDDIFCGNDTVDGLKNLKFQLTSLLKLGGFRLKKWASNSSEVLDGLNIDELANPHLFSNDVSNSIKTLGISWNPKLDTFSYYFHPASISKWTKRSLLSDTAKLFDPLGWISPLILSYKILFQETWIQGSDWDDELSDEIKIRWQRLRDDLSNIQHVQIPRYLGSSSFEIHGFADASKSAYAAALYARFINPDKTVQVYLLSSKSKLAPIKSMSIPRLELCAAHLLAKLLNRTINQFPLSTKVTLWSDSTTVLAWLKSLPRKWNVFVANRVGSVHELCGNISWHYVRSSENPADLASRGMTATQLVNSSLWWQGPKFLQDASFIPAQSNVPDTAEDLAAPKICNVTSLDNFWVQFTLKFSSINRLIRSLCYVLRVRAKARNTLTNHDLTLSTEEFVSAKCFIIKQIQSIYFSAEVDRLSRKQAIRRDSSIRKLTPFLDSGGMLRVSGRLQNASVEYSQIHPVILPKCHLSNLLIIKAHSDSFHGGLSSIVASLRQEYWIIQLQRSAKSIIHSCVRCRRYRGETYQPAMGPLPEARVSETKPFWHTGLDFAGPITLRPYLGRGKITVTGFLAVFVCLSTKAVHLELVMGLSTTALLMALRRFLARRGRCQKFISDNGRNFVGATRAFKEYFKSLDSSCRSSEVVDYLTNHCIIWEFIPRYSPHFGGIWEAAVKSVKRHLFRTFNGSTLTIEEFQTAVCQIECVLNSRPLTPITFDEPLQPITPFHLLTGDSSFLLPDEINSTNNNSSLRQRQQLLQTLIHKFWIAWWNDYLPFLNNKLKWTKSSASARIGDLVLIKRSFDPPRFWHFAQILKLHPGRDGVSRVVDVQTSRGVRREAIRNLVPLLVDVPTSTGGVC